MLVLLVRVVEVATSSIVNSMKKSSAPLLVCDVIVFVLLSRQFRITSSHESNHLLKSSLYVCMVNIISVYFCKKVLLGDFPQKIH